MIGIVCENANVYDLSLQSKSLVEFTNWIYFNLLVYFRQMSSFCSIIQQGNLFN